MTIISSSGEAAGEKRAVCGGRCGKLCASFAGSLCRDRFEGTLEKHSSEKRRACEKTKVFSCALCCSILILGSIRLGIRHFGLREVFCGCGSILICWKALAGMKFSRRKHPDLLESPGRDELCADLPACTTKGNLNDGGYPRS